MTIVSFLTDGFEELEEAEETLELTFYKLGYVLSSSAAIASKS